MKNVDYWTTYNTDISVYCSAYQTFTASESYTLARLYLRLAKRVSAAATTATFELYAVDGSHEPTGDALYSIGSVTLDDLSTSFTWELFDGLSYALTEGTEYAIVCTITGDSVCVNGDLNDSHIRWSSRSGYASGLAKQHYCAYVGGWACQEAWSPYGRDLNFITQREEEVSLDSPADGAEDVSISPNFTITADAKFYWARVVVDSDTHSNHYYFGGKAAGQWTLNLLDDDLDPSTEYDIYVELNFDFNDPPTLDWVDSNINTITTVGPPPKAINPNPEHKEHSTHTTEISSLSWEVPES